MKFFNAFVWAVTFIVCCFELVAIDPVISEFLASNSSGLEDEDGDSSDWIEIWNVSGGEGNLEGYHLTDDPEDLTKWTFGEAPFNNDGYVEVFVPWYEESKIYVYTANPDMQCKKNCHFGF